MADEPTEDALVFGPAAWVYCTAHFRPHTTGWCTVPPRKKNLLDATDRDAAYAEVRARGWPIHGEEP